MSREVTFFFTDMEGSTRLARKLGADYLDLLNQHNNIIRTSVRNHDGKIIENPGDGYFIIFDDPVQAILCAAEIQKKIHTHHWPSGEEVKIRIAVHHGEASESESGFTGIEINRTSRICYAAHGGQTLVSDKVHKMVKHGLPIEIGFKELGTFILRDFDEPTSLVQMTPEDLSDNFPYPRTLTTLPVIAVLPFENPGKNEDQEIFSRGIAEEIIIALGRISGLRVIARSSSFALAAKGLDAQKIGKDLKATAVLEGSIRVSDDRIRVNAELVDSESGVNIWSERYEQRTEDLFTIQDEIARKITSALEVKLSREKVREIKNIQTRVIEAYEYYLRGRGFLYQFSRQSVEFALQMFDKAIEVDPEYALAYCGRADCYSYLYMYSETGQETLDLADKSSMQAVELDPLLAEGYASMGLALSLLKKYNEASLVFEKAIELDPQLYEGYYQYARMAFTEGKLEKAGGLYEKANEVRPEDYQSLLLAGQCYDTLGWPQKALDVRQRGVKIVEDHIHLNPGDTRALYMGANGLVVIGEKKKAMEWLQRAFTLEPEDPMLLYNAGCIYALMEMNDEAFNCLEKSAQTGLTQKEWYIHDSNLDSIREEPRFERLLELLDEINAKS